MLLELQTHESRSTRAVGSHLVDAQEMPALHSCPVPEHRLLRQQHRHRKQLQEKLLAVVGQA